MNSLKLKLGLVAISSLVLVLAACSSPPITTPGGGGGGGGGGGDTGKYSKFGLVGLTNTGTSKVFSGTFYKLATPIAQPTTGGGLPEDTCVVVKSLNEAPTKPGVAGQEITAIDAGAELTVTNTAGTLATLSSSSAGSNPQAKVYFSAPNTTTPDTSGATFNIPGAMGGFPKTMATLPTELAAYTFGPTADITKDTTFEWTSPTPGATVVLGATSGPAANPVVVICFTKDDGSFAFPVVTKTELDSKGFTTGGLLLANKASFKFVPQGDALLIIQSARAATLAP